jgi:succinate-semialdehyde dehydrogenase/glutarate-semialdehyde dehydrogenase
MFVAGAWTGAASGETFVADSPATGEAIAEIPNGSRDDARRAIAAANDASPAWARATAFERAAAMHRVADEIEDRRAELVHVLTLDQGKPLAESRDEVEELIAYWRNAAEDGKRLEGRLANSFTPGKRVLLVRRARGVIGVITPWNWPYTMPAELIAPALAAVALAECVAEADLPPGVFNLVTGPGAEVGDEIARSPGTQGVGFIGSTATGRKVAEAAAGKAAVLELGGNGPVVVLDDGDLELAAAAIVTACFLCAGQSCTAGERLLVHRAVREELVERVAALVDAQVTLGDPFADATTMGPLNNDGVAEKMDRHVADALEHGARVVRGGEREGGFPTRLYWQPTVLDAVPADSLVAREETFGPIAPFVEIESLEQAIELTNASPYGLLSAIFTRDLAKGLRFADEVKTGWVNVNDSSNYWESHLPFGGRAGTDSGIGRVGGTGPMEAFTELQTVVVA